MISNKIDKSYCEGCENLRVSKEGLLYCTNLKKIITPYTLGKCKCFTREINKDERVYDSRISTLDKIYKKMVAFRVLYKDFIIQEILFKQITADFYSRLNNVSEREQKILKGYYIENKTFDALGKEIGITRERIRQILEKALRKMKLKVGHYEIDDSKFQQYLCNVKKETDSETLKKIIELRFFKNFKIKDIAKKLNISIANVGNQINRIKQKVQKESILNNDIDDLMVSYKDIENEILREIKTNEAVVIKDIDEDGKARYEILKDSEPISVLDLSIRGYTALKRYGINKINDLIEFLYVDHEDLRKIRNLGKKTIDEIKRELEKYIKENKIKV